MRKFKIWIWLSLFIFILLALVLQFTPQKYFYYYFVREAQSANITDLAGYTGKIGQEDIEWGNGLDSDTFTVPSYGAGTVTLTKMPALVANVASIIKGKWYVTTSASIGDHGNPAVTGSLAWIIATIGSDSRAIEIPPAVYPISTAMTGVSAIPANVVTIFQPGAQLACNAATTHNGGVICQGGSLPHFDIASGKTLTFATRRIQAPIECQIFTGDGSIVFPDGSELMSGWFASLATAITKIGAVKATLVQAAPYVMTSDITIPATLHYQILYGNCITTTGYILTIGKFGAGRYQTFTGTGTVKFGPGAMEKVFPELWGAIPDNLTDNFTALQACIDTISTMTWSGDGGDYFGYGTAETGVMSLDYGTYLYNGNLTCATDIVIEGTGRGSILLCTATSGIALHLDPTTTVRGTYLRHFSLMAHATPASTTADIGLQWGNTTSGTSGLRMEDILISDFANDGVNGIGFYAPQVVTGGAQNCYFYRNWIGTKLGGGSGIGTTFSFNRCEWRENGYNGGVGSGLAAGYAMYLSNMKGLTITNCVFESNWGDAIHEVSTGAHPSEFLKIKDGTWFENNGRNQSNATYQYYDIYLNNNNNAQRHVEITESFFLDGYYITAAPIYMSGSFWYPVITGNFLTDIQGNQVTAVNEFTFNDNGGSADTITSATYDFTANGYERYKYISVSGSTSNDGTYLVTAVAANTLTLTTGVLTAEAPAATKETSIEGISIIFSAMPISPTINNNTTLRAPRAWNQTVAALGLTFGNPSTQTALFNPYNSNAISADGSTWYTIVDLRNSASAIGAVVDILGNNGATYGHDFYDRVCFSYGALGNIQYNDLGSGTSGYGSATWDPPSIAAGSYGTTDITVNGCALGDFVPWKSFSLDVSDLVLDAQVTGPNTVTCVLTNNTPLAIDLASGTIRVKTAPAFGTAPKRSYQVLDNHKLQIQIADPGGSPNFRIRVLVYGELY